MTVWLGVAVISFLADTWQFGLGWQLFHFWQIHDSLAWGGSYFIFDRYMTVWLGGGTYFIFDRYTTVWLGGGS